MIVFWKGSRKSFTDPKILQILVQKLRSELELYEVRFENPEYYLFISKHSHTLSLSL